MNILLIETDLSLNIEISNKLNSFFPNFQQIRVYSATNESKAHEILSYTTIDVFIVNIEQSNNSGINIMSDIRLMKKYELSWLIYYGKNYSKMRAALNTNFIDFFILPLNEIRFKKTLNKLKWYSPKRKSLSPLVLKYKGDIYTFEQENIIYIETVNKYLYITTDTTKVCVGRIAIDKIKLVLNNDLFYKCNRSTIVNLSKIAQVKKDSRIHYLQFKNKNEKVYVTEKYKEIINNLVEEA